MSQFSHVDELLKSFVKNGLPGCGCALAKEGKVLYEGYQGLADIESGRPVDKDTVYRLFSMTKVIVCTAAMMLYERGKFLLSDPLYEYMPEYRTHTVAKANPDGTFSLEESKKPMLIRDAFTMSVGLPYQSGDSPTAVALREAEKKPER